MKTNILIVAGEPSGDIRGAELVRALKRVMPGVGLWGIGGDEMSGEGVHLVDHIKNLSMVGGTEIITKLPRIYRQFRNLTENIDSRKPAMAILIDYPGFNLKVAYHLHRRGIPVIYYIIPQVWAWGAWRVKKIKKYVLKALVLFPFEEKFLKKYGIDCEFVGHPIVDRLGKTAKPPPEKKINTTIALLPGSRQHEIRSMVPSMLEAARKIKESNNKTDFVIAESPNIDRSVYDAYLSGYGDLPIKRLRNNTEKALSECDLAIVTSGTATLEAAMMEKPMVIVYKASPLTYIFYLILSRIPYLGLVNIIAGKEAVPELLQKNMTAEKISSAILEMAFDPLKRKGTVEDLRKVKSDLGEGGTAEKAAGIIKATASYLGIN